MQNYLIAISILSANLITTMSQANNSSNITIYSGKHQGQLNQHQLQDAYNIPGFAVVRQQQMTDFKPGQFELVFDEVAEYIDPTTVSFTTPENPDAAAVLEQNFQFDLVGSDKLLEKYLDQTIQVEYGQGEQTKVSTGQLLSTQGGITLLQQDQSIITIKQWERIEFPKLPGGLRTKPALVWLLDSTSNQAELINVSYQTQGMTWWADYNITLKESNNQCQMDLSSWVSIVNKTGASFEQTKLKLIAGDVNRIENNRIQPMARNTLAASSQDQFSEQALFEYHLYDLPRRVDLPNNSTKQIQLLNNTSGIECERVLTFNGSGQSRINHRRPIKDANYLNSTDAKVDVLLRFDNSNKNQLGVPLPAGRIRVNTLNTTDNNLEFIGEDSIDHTPKNNQVELKLGQSFDVKGSRVQRQFELLPNGLIERFSITINNQKSSAETIHIIEPLYRWSNWTITQHNEEYEKLNANTISFKLQVPPETSKTIDYTVQYNWPKELK